eukprot:TRINITY_DN24394_c2_g1_i2.p1 TRINITY_DN24394_c2_g1~~TRINITY_DN24394_c2_g1_i2.p1  ORF type:complete len:110 (+),score=14.47 TRINITY_DN24394_c2_g1_i2:31-360(+)
MKTIFHSIAESSCHTNTPYGFIFATRGFHAPRVSISMGEESYISNPPPIGNPKSLSSKISSFFFLLCKENVLHQTTKEWIALKISSILPSTTEPSHCTRVCLFEIYMNS